MLPLKILSVHDVLKNFRTKVLPNLPTKSLLVVDKASYHMRFTGELAYFDIEPIMNIREIVGGSINCL